MIVSVTTITIPSSTADPNGYLARAIAASGGLKGAAVALVRGLDDAGGGVDVIAKAGEQQSRRDALSSMHSAGTWRSDLALCKVRLSMLTERERAFVTSIDRQKQPTLTQQFWLRDIADRQRRGCRR